MKVKLRLHIALYTFVIYKIGVPKYCLKNKESPKIVIDRNKNWIIMLLLLFFFYIFFCFLNYSSNAVMSTLECNKFVSDDDDDFKLKY